MLKDSRKAADALVGCCAVAATLSSQSNRLELSLARTLVRSRPTESAVERAGCWRHWIGYATKWDDVRRQEGKDMSDPHDWLGWEHYRHWKRAVRRWNRTTDIPVAQGPDRLFKELDWQLQVKFEHINNATLLSWTGSILDSR